MPEPAPSQEDFLPPLIPVPAELAPEPVVEGRATEAPGGIVNLVEPSIADLDPIEGPRCWFCGIAEAIAWFAGIVIVQLGSGIALAVLLIVAALIQTGRISPDILEKQVFVLLAGGESIFFAVTLLAISLRYWGRTRNELNFSLPDYRHVLIVAGVTLPMAFCVSAWQQPIQMVWNYVLESYPQLRFLDELSSAKLVAELVGSVNLPGMILVVAVMPAICEEILFRGAIGRVLVSNCGIWFGVFATSFLFGWCHVHPVHAVAIMPVGIALHYVYLTTRSFWIPMLLHFANNCWAVVLTKYGAEEPVINGFQTTILDAIELIAAAVAVIATAIALQQSRVRFYRQDGREWSSTRFPIRVPPSPGIRRVASPMGPVSIGIAIGCIVVCHLTLAINNLVFFH